MFILPFFLVIVRMKIEGGVSVSKIKVPVILSVF